MLGVSEGCHNMWSVLKIILTLLIAEMEALQLTKLDVPGAVVFGDPVWLECGYELEEDQLYSVKWYKNNIEFYRFLPNDHPPGQKYDLTGVHVSLKKSNGSHVYLHTVDLSSEGTYGCEVSAEAPSFRTVKAEKEMNIYVAPDDSPQILGAEVWYEIDDYVNITCQTSPSLPVAQLDWLINGKEAPATYKHPQKDYKHKGPMKSSEMGLGFQVKKDHFSRGQMNLDCVSTVYQVYARTSQELVVGERSSAIEPHLVPHVAPGQQAPKITGGLRKYVVGEDLDINCTAPRAKPVANISWFINEIEAKPHQIIQYDTILEFDDRHTAISGLHFRVRREDFHGQELRIKCSAAVSKVVHVSSDEIVIGGSQQSSGLHVGENNMPVRSGSKPSGQPSSLPNYSLLCVLLFMIITVHLCCQNFVR